MSSRPVSPVNAIEPIEEIVTLLPRLVRELRADAAAHGVGDLTYAQTKMLVHLFQEGEGSVTDVAAGVGVSLAAASEVIDRLVEQGWVARGHDRLDRRRVVISLTPRAIAMGTRMQSRRCQQVSAALASFSDSERGTVAAALHAIAAVLSGDRHLEPDHAPADVAPADLAPR